MNKRVISAVAAVFLSGCATIEHKSSLALAPGARYVAMGSSYAAGAQIGTLAPDSPRRCGRTQNNYPHLVAAEMGLVLVDVSCGGATTAHILGPWSELPPQIDAVTPDTKLVTVTIGGNDLNYVGNLVTAACGRTPGITPRSGRPCPPVDWPNESAYRGLEERLRQIAREVRQRAPQARLVFVGYVRIVPDAGSCADVPLAAAQSAAARKALRRMTEVMRRAASAEGAMLLSMEDLSRGHDACSTTPWSAGHPGKPADWHPTAAGHEAIAKALVARLK